MHVASPVILDTRWFYAPLLLAALSAGGLSSGDSEGGGASSGCGQKAATVGVAGGAGFLALARACSHADDLGRVGRVAGTATGVATFGDDAARIGVTAVGQVADDAAHLGSVTDDLLKPLPGEGALVDEGLHPVLPPVEVRLPALDPAAGLTDEVARTGPRGEKVVRDVAVDGAQVVLEEAVDDGEDPVPVPGEKQAP